MHFHLFIEWYVSHNCQLLDPNTQNTSFLSHSVLSHCVAVAQKREPCQVLLTNTSTEHVERCRTTGSSHALAEKSSDPERGLNLTASITRSKNTTNLISLDDTDTHKHFLPLPHSFALLPTLHSMQHARGWEKGFACRWCMHVCACESAFICLCLHCVCDGGLWDIVSSNREYSVVCLSSRSHPLSSAVVSAPSSCSWKLHSAWMSC